MELYIFFLIIGLIFGLQIIMVTINILQKGGKYKGQTIEEIMGKKAEDITVNDIEKLSKSEVFQLFYSAEVPEFSSVKGEYLAKTLSVGIMAPAADFITHNIFGPGRWEGKAFYPSDTDKGWGYNIFSKPVNGENKIFRTRKMDTFSGPSKIDSKDSFNLVYRSYNSGIVKSMRDEIRKVNGSIFICMGYMGIGGGSINPAPFILYGEPIEWVGLDKP